MKKKTGIIIGIIGVIMIAGIIVWQSVKKDVVKNAIENAVSKGSGNEYYLKYDSSNIDAVAGNATFFNIVLQSDSVQKKMLENDTSLSPTIYNVRVQSLTISGANIPSLLQKNKIEATKIQIIKPVITIISTGIKAHQMTKEDTLALYKKLTGKFNSIHAEVIEVIDARIAFANGTKSPHTTFQDVNLVLKNLNIDEEHNYDDIVSYFVKDLVVTAKTITSVNEKARETLIAEGIKYSAPAKTLQISNVLEKNSVTDEPIINIQGIMIAGINTNQFVYANKIQAETLSTESGKMTIFAKKGNGNKKVSLDLSNGFFNTIQVRNIDLGTTDIKIINAKPGKDPILIKKVKFSAFGLGTIREGTNLKNIIAHSRWNLSSDGFSMKSGDGLYELIFGPFKASSADKTLIISHFNVTPTISWEVYAKRIKVQHDYYVIEAKNLNFNRLNLAKLINDQEIDAGELSLNLTLRTFNDRLVPYDKSSKVGLYPQQQLMDVDIPLNIRKININNGSVIYRERGRISAQTGDVSFTNINATVTNVTNIPAIISKNNTMLLQATSKFMQASNLKTTWVLPLAKANSTFKVSGSLTGFDATALNKISEPLGMASITKGKINGLSFSMTGNDYHANGDAILKYDNLKIKLLKSKGDSTTALEDKDLVSFAANIFIKNSNPKNGNLRTGKIDFDRDITKSFFNLLWKSIFQAVKRIAKGKDDE